MILKKLQSKDFLLIFLKILCWTIGLDIFLTSFFMIIKEEFNNKNLESEINLNIKKPKSEQNVQVNRDIY